MLGNIIKQITQERHDNKSISTQLGTNQIHTLSNVKGFRKVGRNMSFGLFAPPAAVVDIDARDLINKRMAIINAPAPHVPEEAPAPHVTEEAPASHVPEEAPAPHVPEEAPASHVTEEAPAPHVPEEAPATEEEQESTPPTGEITPIEIESTLSE